MARCQPTSYLKPITPICSSVVQQTAVLGGAKLTKHSCPEVTAVFSLAGGLTYARCGQQLLTALKTSASANAGEEPGT
jgi:hypothetical protein